ncbi:MAG: peptide deformylase [Candidatus Wildermuthbacteria bacterium]|nr:peptide deformylase [Candidatus Wildermuthbacteria bacterium]
MSRLSIITYPTPILKERAKEVEQLTPELKALIGEMIEAMKEHNGIGLAAPQINISQRIIIVQDANGSHAFLNPRIISKGKKQSAEEEGCLSLPGIFVPVKRSDYVKVVCDTPKGEEVHLKAEGLVARIFQHEIDHLNGNLIINRINPLQRFKIRKHLKEFERAWKNSSRISKKAAG